MKPLLDLQESDCRFPFGDGPFLFCAEVAMTGSAYCVEHHAICWTKPIPVKKLARETA